jgi:hypothetical protein
MAAVMSCANALYVHSIVKYAMNMNTEWLLHDCILHR